MFLSTLTAHGCAHKFTPCHAHSRLQSLRSPRALGATISGMCHRYRLHSETGWAEFGYFLVISKWLLPELSIPAAGLKDRRLWGREWLPARICHSNYTRYQKKLDSGREIQKIKLHTQKISLEFYEHKVYYCFSFSLLHHILSSLHQRRKSCLKVHARFRFILKSNINTENGNAPICLN